MKTLALPLRGFELDMEYKRHEAYQLQTSQNPFLPFCYFCVYAMAEPHVSLRGPWPLQNFLFFYTIYVYFINI